MTLEELQENWRDYGVVVPIGDVVPLKELFAECLGEFQGGLLFEPEDPDRGAAGMILKPDPEGNCYAYTDSTAEGEDRWSLQGRFVRLEEGE